jgi:ectoine hydroxylase-related dioxygenase (phytanoyl-CoA dioxygenase family)
MNWLKNTAGDLRVLGRGLLRTRSLKELNYYLCRFFGRGARERIADTCARLLPPPSQPAPASSSRVRQLEQRGYTMLEGICSAEQADALYRELRDVHCHDPHRKELGVFTRDTVPGVTRVAQLDVAALLRSPAAMRLANHPDVLSVVEGWLGARPTALFTAWWSIATDGPAEHAQLFHRDKDDWRFVKLFVYLTDVDDQSGPHVYVPGSHRPLRGEFSGQRRYQDEEVEREYGKDATRLFTGARGTAFLENTYGLHKGLPPRRGERLIFQVTYSLFPLLYAPDQPLVKSSELPFEYDPYVHRLYVDQTS